MPFDWRSVHPPRRDDRLATFGFFAFVFAGVIALPGVVLTFFYRRRRYGWIRSSYRVLLFLTIVANVLIFTTDARCGSRQCPGCPV